jgi:hypothetical protein
MSHQSEPRKLRRRHFLQIGTASAIGLSLSQALEFEARAQTNSRVLAKANSVILVWLSGGPSTIDMWDMKPNASAKIRGEFKPASTSLEGVQICEHLPKLAAVLDRCCLVRSMTHTLAEHSIGAKYLMTGNRPSPALDYPSIGSIAARLLPEPKGIPSYMTLGSQPSSGVGFLESTYSPFEVTSFPFGPPSPSSNAQMKMDLPPAVASLPDGFSVDDLQRRDKVLQIIEDHFRKLDNSNYAASLSHFQQRAIDILRSGKIKKALDVSEERERLEAIYGRGVFAQSALAARRLIEAGVRFVTVGLDGWDTHADNFAQLRFRLLPQLDHGLAGLISDLDERGVLATTIVYCVGEFGRTPKVNDGAGRDHWPRATAALLAGGGLQRGFVYGATDPEGSEPTIDPCSPDDVSATIFHQLGFAPDYRVATSTSGRSVALFQEGKVIRALV